MAITVYGIKNCDTMKKALKWLDQQGLEYHFHDYKKDGVPEAPLRRWIDALGWDTVINRRGTTWRKLTRAPATIWTRKARWRRRGTTRH